MSYQTQKKNRDSCELMFSKLIWVFQAAQLHGPLTIVTITGDFHSIACNYEDLID